MGRKYTKLMEGSPARSVHSAASEEPLSYAQTGTLLSMVDSPSISSSDDDHDDEGGSSSAHTSSRRSQTSNVLRATPRITTPTTARPIRPARVTRPTRAASIMSPPPSSSLLESHLARRTLIHEILDEHCQNSRADIESSGDDDLDSLIDHDSEPENNDRGSQSRQQYNGGGVPNTSHSRSEIGMSTRTDTESVEVPFGVDSDYEQESYPDMKSEDLSKEASEGENTAESVDVSDEEMSHDQQQEDDPESEVESVEVSSEESSVDRDQSSLPGSERIQGDDASAAEDPSHQEVELESDVESVAVSSDEGSDGDQESLPQSDYGTSVDASDDEMSDSQPQEDDVSDEEMLYGQHHEDNPESDVESVEVSSSDEASVDRGLSSLPGRARIPGDEGVPPSHHYTDMEPESDVESVAVSSEEGSDGDQESLPGSDYGASTDLSDEEMSDGPRQEDDLSDEDMSHGHPQDDDFTDKDTSHSQQQKDDVSDEDMSHGQQQEDDVSDEEMAQQEDDPESDVESVEVSSEEASVDRDQSSLPGSARIQSDDDSAEESPKYRQEVELESDVESVAVSSDEGSDGDQESLPQSDYGASVDVSDEEMSHDQQQEDDPERDAESGTFSSEEDSEYGEQSLAGSDTERVDDSNHWQQGDPGSDVESATVSGDEDSDPEQTPQSSYSTNDENDFESAIVSSHEGSDSERVASAPEDSSHHEQYMETESDAESVPLSSGKRSDTSSVGMAHDESSRGDQESRTDSDVESAVVSLDEGSETERVAMTREELSPYMKETEARSDARNITVSSQEGGARDSAGMSSEASSHDDQETGPDSDVESAVVSSDDESDAVISSDEESDRNHRSLQESESDNSELEPDESSHYDHDIGTESDVESAVVSSDDESDHKDGSSSGNESESVQMVEESSRHQQEMETDSDAETAEISTEEEASEPGSPSNYKTELKRDGDVSLQNYSDYKQRVQPDTGTNSEMEKLDRSYEEVSNYEPRSTRGPRDDTKRRSSGSHSSADKAKSTTMVNLSSNTITSEASNQNSSASTTLTEPTGNDKSKHPTTFTSGEKSSTNGWDENISSRPQQKYQGKNRLEPLIPHMNSVKPDKEESGENKSESHVKGRSKAKGQNGALYATIDTTNGSTTHVAGKNTATTASKEMGESSPRKDMAANMGVNAERTQPDDILDKDSQKPDVDDASKPEGQVANETGAATRVVLGQDSPKGQSYVRELSYSKSQRKGSTDRSNGKRAKGKSSKVISHEMDKTAVEVDSSLESPLPFIGQNRLPSRGNTSDKDSGLIEDSSNLMLQVQRNEEPNTAEVHERPYLRESKEPTVSRLQDEKSKEGVEIIWNPTTLKDYYDEDHLKSPVGKPKKDSAEYVVSSRTNTENQPTSKKRKKKSASKKERAQAKTGKLIKKNMAHEHSFEESVQSFDTSGEYEDIEVEMDDEGRPFSHENYSDDDGRLQLGDYSSTPEAIVRTDEKRRVKADVKEFRGSSGIFGDKNSDSRPTHGSHHHEISQPESPERQRGRPNSSRSTGNRSRSRSIERVVKAAGRSFMGLRRSWRRSRSGSCDRSSGDSSSQLNVTRSFRDGSVDSRRSFEKNDNYLQSAPLNDRDDQIFETRPAGRKSNRVSDAFEQPKTVAEQREERKRLYILDQQRRNSTLIQSALRGYVARKKLGIILPKNRFLDDSSDADGVFEYYVPRNTDTFVTRKDPAGEVSRTASRASTVNTMRPSIPPVELGLRSREHGFQAPTSVAEQREARRLVYLRDQEHRYSIVIQAYLRGYIQRKKLGIIMPAAMSESSKLLERGRHHEQSYIDGSAPPQSSKSSKKKKIKKLFSYLKPTKIISRSKRKEVPNVQRFNASLYLQERIYKEEQQTMTKSLLEVQNDRRRMYLLDLQRREAIKIQAATRGFLLRKKLFPSRYKKKKKKKGDAAAVESTRKNANKKSETAVLSKTEVKRTTETGVAGGSFDRSSYLIERLQRDEAERQTKTVAEIRSERQQIYLRDLQRREVVKIQAAMRGFMTRSRYPWYAHASRVTSQDHGHGDETSGKRKGGWGSVRRFLGGGSKDAGRKEKEVDPPEQLHDVFNPYADPYVTDFFGFQDTKRNHRTGFFEVEKTQDHAVQLHGYTEKGRHWNGRGPKKSSISFDAAANTHAQSAVEELRRKAETMAQKRTVREAAEKRALESQPDITTKEMGKDKKEQKKIKKAQMKNKHKKNSSDQATGTDHRSEKVMVKSKASADVTSRKAPTMNVSKANNKLSKVKPITIGNPSPTNNDSVEWMEESSYWEEEIIEPSPIPPVVFSDHKKEKMHSGMTHSADIGTAGYWLPSAGPKDSRSYREPSYVPDGSYNKYYKQKPVKVATIPYWESVRSDILPVLHTSAGGDNSGAPLVMIPTLKPTQDTFNSIISTEKSVVGEECWLPPGDPRAKTRVIPTGSDDVEPTDNDSWVPLPSRKAHSKPRRVDFSGTLSSPKEASWAPHLPSPSKRPMTSIDKLRLGDLEAPPLLMPSSPSRQSRATSIINVPMGDATPPSPAKVSQQEQDHRRSLMVLCVVFLMLAGAGATCAHFFWDDVPWKKR